MPRYHSIFYFVFIQTITILIVVNLIYLSIIVPHFQKKLEITLVDNVDTFANTAMAACSDALYSKDYSFVIDYIMRVIKQTPTIVFVIFRPDNGPNIIVTDKQWRLTENDMQQLHKDLHETKKEYIIETKVNELIQQKVLHYSKRFSINQLDWGTLTIGVNDDDYQQLMQGLLNNILSMIIILVLTSIIVLFGTSKYIGRQLNKLQRAANKLAKGDFSSRAPTSLIQEINTLTNSFNYMADSIESKTNQINLLAAVVETNQDGIIILDNQKHICFVNHAAKKLVKREPEDKKSFSQLVNAMGLLEEDIRHICNNFSTHSQEWSQDISIKQADKSKQYFNVRIGFFRTENRPVFYHFIVLRNITQRKKFEHELNQLAFYDKLTGLPNRRLFIDRLEHTISIAKRRNNKFVLMFMDLDNFKNINDSLGHDYGDELLKIVAERLRKLLRQEDTVCRLGGDEFTIILNALSNQEQTKKIAKKIIEAIKKPYQVKGQTLMIGISIGIISYPENGGNNNELMKKADLAMYQAKRAGKNDFRFYQERT